MSMKVNKPRNTGVQATVPIARTQRLQFNHDTIDENGDPKIPTIIVIIEFFESQTTLDAGEPAFDIRSYQIDEPPALDNLINTELKNLPDFDMAT